MSRWEIALDGHGEKRVGSVIAGDGEIIGTWSADENDFYSFMPNGEEEPVIGNYFLAGFCSDVADWHETRRAP